ncbi:MAG: hypothetical protein AB1467_01950 [Candidatus Diapherotrites archaeon]
MRLNKYFLIAGLILIVIAIAGTAKATTLEGQFNASTYQCQTTQEIFNLCNDTGGTQIYSVYTTGEQSAWMQLRPLKLSLQPNECADIYAFITPPCYSNAGNYTIGVEAKASDITRKEFSLSVLQGHTLDLSIDQEAKEGFQCEKKNYSLNIKNTGRFDERVKLSVTGIPSDWFLLDSELPIILKGETMQVNLSVQAPCNAELKEYNFTAKAEILNSDFSTERNLSYIIRNGQEVLVSLPESIQACKDAETKGEIEIKNNGMQAEKLSLSLNAPNWITLNTSTISLNPNESKKIELTLKENDQEEKSYDLEFTAKSSKFNLSYTKKALVELKDCYNIKTQVISAPTESCLEEKPEIKFNLTNTGTKETELKLSTAGVPAELSKKAFIIQPGATEEMTALLDPAALSAVGGIKFKLLLDSEHFHSSTDTEINFSKCYSASLELQGLKLCKKVSGMNSSVKLTNQGTKKQLFFIDSSIDWIKPEQKSFELNSGESKVINLFIDVPEKATEQEFTITAKSEQLELKQKANISYGTLTQCFKVDLIPSDKILDINAGEGKITTLKITNKGVTKQKVSISVKDNEWTYFDPKQLEIPKDETREAYIYFNPPYDFKEDTAVIVLKAETDYGFVTTTEFKLNIFGGSIALTLNPQEIKIVEAKISGITEEKFREVEVLLSLSNDTNSTIKIMDMKAKDLNALFIVSNPVVKSKSSITIKMQFTADENVDLNKLVVPITITTDKGIYVKEVPVKVFAEKAKAKEGKKAQPTGLSALFKDTQKLSIVLLIIIVVLLIAFIAVKSRSMASKSGEPKEKEESLALESIKSAVTKKKTRKKRKR